MAEVKKQRVICPKCGSRIEVGIWDCIEMPYDMEKKESIMNQTFFKLNCDACKNVFPIAYKCIYNDMEQKYMIWLVPRLGEGELEEINAYNLQLMTDNRLALPREDTGTGLSAMTESCGKRYLFLTKGWMTAILKR